MKNDKLTYTDSGVDLKAWSDAKKRIGRLVESTFNNKVVGGFGQFGGLFDISEAKKYNKPVLVSSVDGVGTKLKIAFETRVHNTVGRDIVNHCIDDIIVMGARPLYFLDYLGTGRLLPDVSEEIVRGLSGACKDAGISLIAGETAEMPGFYEEGEYDIAGTIVGIVEKEKILDGKEIAKGDVVVGLRSNGLHTNGYSLARKIVVSVARKKYSDIFTATGVTFGEELLRPHRSYLTMLKLIEEGLIKGCAHITGGGFQDNIDRILPKDCDASIDTTAWEPDPIFQFLQREGNVDSEEMYHTFNMGMGMVIAVDNDKAEALIKRNELAKYDPVVIGEIIQGDGTVLLR